jgi:hypothetical protein
MKNDFFRAHKLALHPAKTKFMFFSSNPGVRAADCLINIDCNNDSEQSSHDLINPQSPKFALIRILLLLNSSELTLTFY